MERHRFPVHARYSEGRGARAFVRITAFIRSAVFCTGAALVAAADAQVPLISKAPQDQERSAALAAYDAGRSAEARASLQKLSTRYPNDFAVQEALGLLEAEAGDVQAALPHLTAATRTKPKDAAAEANLGAAFLTLKQAPEAVAALQKAAVLDSSNREVQIELGRALFLDGQPGPAAELLGKASRLQPEDQTLRYDWIVALDASHESEPAYRELASSSMQATTPAMEALWGDVAEHAGHFEQAVMHMQRAAQLDPSEPNLYALTVELLRHWTWQPAQQVAEYGMARFPESQRLRFADGVSLFGETQFAKAADVFAALLKQSPESESYGDLLGRSCAALGGDASANCGALVSFAEQHPANAKVAVFAAISILHRPEDDQELPKAEALLQQSIAHDPQNAEAFYQLGVLQQQRQQWAESQTSLQRAITLRPAYAEAHYRLSRAYAHLGMKDQAAQELTLQKRYAQQDKEASDTQLKEVTIFLTQKP